MGRGGRRRLWRRACRRQFQQAQRREAVAMRQTYNRGWHAGGGHRQGGDQRHDTGGAFGPYLLLDRSVKATGVDGLKAFGRADNNGLTGFGCRHGGKGHQRADNNGKKRRQKCQRARIGPVFGLAPVHGTLCRSQVFRRKWHKRPHLDTSCFV